MSTVVAEQRFTRRHPCPVCGGGDDLPRGKGKRCSGYLSSDGRFAYCAREELAGGLEPETKTEPATFRHYLAGDCHCGTVHGVRPHGSDDRAQSTFVYVDEQGNPLYRTSRLDGPEGKRIWQERFEEGRFVKGLGRSRRVLYRLPELADAEMIHVVEGERCADALAELGFVATTSPMGAGKWQDEYAATVAAGAFTVYVWPDCDAEGRSHAEAIARSLTERAVPQVLIVELGRNREDGYDVADVLAEGRRNGNRDDLRGYVEAIVSEALDLDTWRAYRLPTDLEPAASLEDDYPGEDSTESAGSEPAPFFGLSHAEVLDLSFADEPAELVEGLIPRGVLVVCAGLPETYKGWICAKASMIVAAGEGELFGRSARAQGSVGYFWQDDSTRNEAERVQLFARVHETPRDLPIRWFLNEGVILPDDVARLRATIEHHQLVMVVLDSVYNFVPGLDMKDRDVGQLFARIKAEICDPTGCTVLVVDHMPWATDQNRKRLRSYGDVFKGAAARAGIYVDAEGSKLYVEARGNNVVGFKRTPAYWDADALELRLVDTSRQEEDDEELEERVLEWLAEHPGSHATRKVREGVTGGNQRIDATLERLKERGAVRDHARNGGAWSGAERAPRYWIASVHAEDTAPALFGAQAGDCAPGASDEQSAPAAPVPRRGAQTDRGADSGNVFDGSPPPARPTFSANAAREEPSP